MNTLSTADSCLFIPPSAFCQRGIFLSYTPDLGSTLSPEAMNAFLTLQEMVHRDPKGALPKLQKFALDHPTAAVVDNLLTYLYIRMRKVKTADQRIEESYSKYPDYLIAKINYADLLLRRKQTDKIPGLFQETFDLTELYPEKETFHYAEFRGFIVTLGFYHHAIRAKEKALECYRLAVLADPMHPSVRALEKKVFPSPLRKFGAIIGLPSFFS